MGKSKLYTLVGEFKKMSSAIDCVGVLQHKKIADIPTVHPGQGCYEVRVGNFHAKKSAEAVLEDITKNTTYTFIIKEV
jgi:hypothetical protein